MSTQTLPRIHVLHVITGLDTGGAETFLSQLAPRLQAVGVRSSVASLTDDGDLAAGLRRSGVGVVSIGLRPSRPLQGLRRLHRVMAVARPDVVMTWLVHADLLAGVVARTRGIPVVWNLRSDMADRDPVPAHRAIVGLQRRISGVVPRHVVCVSQSALDAHRGAGFSGVSVEVIPNGFDTTRFRPDADARRSAREELGAGPDTVVVGHVARVDPVKDHRSGLLGFAGFHRSRPDSLLVLCGSGTVDLTAELRDVVGRTGIGHAVRGLGKRTDVARLTNAFDVAMCSSRFEGMSNTLGEAMACGVRPVSTDVGGARDLVGDTGIVVPVGDGAALGSALGEVLELTGPSPRQRILDRFDLDASVRRYAEVLRWVARR